MNLKKLGYVFFVLVLGLFASCSGNNIKSSAKDITAFSIGDRVGVISGTDITVTMLYGTTDVTDLTSTITVSPGASVTVAPASGVAQDFTNPVAYTVTAADGTTKEYTVTVMVAASDAKNITMFSFPEGTGTITGTNIAVTVPFVTVVTALTPTIAITGDSVDPASGVAQDFTNPVTYTVTAADGTTKDYEVTATLAAASTIATVTSGAYTVSTVGGGAETIINVPFGTSKAAFEAALVKGEPNQTWDDSVTGLISNPVVTGDTLVVTAQDGTTAVTYTVTVNAAVSDIATVTSGVYTVSAGGTLTETIINVPFGTSKAAFQAALVKGESHQTWDVTDIDATVVTGNTLVVTSQDLSTTVTYTVTVILPSADDTLNTATSTIKGEVVTLGAPGGLGSITAGAGSDIINAAEAADTSNLAPYVTLFDPTNAYATTRVVKLATGVAEPANLADFNAIPAYTNEAITSLDRFIIEVTAQDGITVQYYEILVTVL